MPRPTLDGHFRRHRHRQDRYRNRDARSLGECNWQPRSEEHTSELQSQSNLVCRLLLEKKKTTMKVHLFALVLLWRLISAFIGYTGLITIYYHLRYTHVTESVIPLSILATCCCL